MKGMEMTIEEALKEIEGRKEAMRVMERAYGDLCLENQRLHAKLHQAMVEAQELEAWRDAWTLVAAPASSFFNGWDACKLAMRMSMKQKGFPPA